jgi:hypothetical protein
LEAIVIELSGEEIDAVRAFVNPFCKWATAGGKDDERHPNYRWVTGGRDFGPGYSSCADLYHALVYCLGVRLPWVNTHMFTEGDMGKSGWDVGVNVSRLTGDVPPGLRPAPVPGVRFDAGDCLIVWNQPTGKDAHVMVALEHDGGERLLVAEFGQPGGHIKLKRVFEQNGALFLEGRLTNKRLQRWIPLDRVLMSAAAKDLLEERTYPLNFDRRDTEPAPPPEINT